jgi:hypothetical protein
MEENISDKVLKRAKNALFQISDNNSSISDAPLIPLFLK